MTSFHYEPITTKCKNSDFAQFRLTLFEAVCVGWFRDKYFLSNICQNCGINGRKHEWQFLSRPGHSWCNYPPNIFIHKNHITYNSDALWQMSWKISIFLEPFPNIQIFHSEIIFHGKLFHSEIIFHGKWGQISLMQLFAPKVLLDFLRPTIT